MADFRGRSIPGAARSILGQAHMPITAGSTIFVVGETLVSLSGVFANVVTLQKKVFHATFLVGPLRGCEHSRTREAGSQHERCSRLTATKGSQRRPQIVSEGRTRITFAGPAPDPASPLKGTPFGRDSALSLMQNAPDRKHRLTSRVTFRVLSWVPGASSPKANQATRTQSCFIWNAGRPSPPSRPPRDAALSRRGADGNANAVSVRPAGVTTHWRPSSM